VSGRKHESKWERGSGCHGCSRALIGGQGKAGVMAGVNGLNTIEGRVRLRGRLSWHLVQEYERMEWLCFRF
jgi:hypothetical protein